ncbi:hypothetical protein BH20ACT14_BH20ACT14_12010 [soil metagenome]|nr:hypothetical protein [Actinomycetota bacterium]MDQ3426027.1 hypothetical protein [Actinomycetota bacterium]
MDKNKKVTLVAGAALALLLAVVLGASAAIAGSRVLGSNDESQAVIEDAAAELGVEPSALEEALEEGLKNRVREAVEAGRLTDKQGAELQNRIESGDTPFLFGGFGRFHGLGRDRRPGHLGHLAGMDAAASYLGLTRDELREQLHDGKTLSAIAKAEGKSVDDFIRAMVNAAKKELDAAVAADRVTRERANMIEQDLEARITGLVNAELRLGPFGPHRRFGSGFRLHGESPFFSGPRS